MAREKDILDEAIRHQVYLERHGAELSAKARKSVSKVAKTSTSKLMQLDHELTDDGYGAMGELIREIQADDVAIMATAATDLAEDLASLADYESGYTARSLRSATRKVKILSMDAGKAYQAALRQPVTATGDMLESFIDGWSKNTVDAVNRAVRHGYEQGLTNQQIVQTIRGTRAANFSDGLVESMGRNADAVVRTSVQHVANTARMETWAKNSDVVEGYKIVATLDGKTTQICRSMDGKVFKLGKGPRPPFHIRCRTTTVAELDQEFAFLDEGATRSSEGGPVPSEMSYYDWLKTQPADFQADTIGVARAKLLRDGGLSADEFARLNLGRNFQPLTLDEMRKREPEAFKKAGI